VLQEVSLHGRLHNPSGFPTKRKWRFNERGLRGFPVEENWQGWQVFVSASASSQYLMVMVAVNLL